MKRVLRWILVGLLLVAAGVATVALLARLNDGPLGPFPGGPMRGQVVREPVDDWSFAAELDTLALQTFDPPRSRTVWLVVHEGGLYVPSGFVAAKSWPHQVLESPMVLLRVDGDLYVRRAVRVTDPERLEALWGRVREKYGADVGGDHEGNWMFRMDPVGADG